MARIDIVCPNCRQVNRRGVDFWGRLLDPRQPKLCTLCGTDLHTGKRSKGGLLLAVLGYGASYFLHALVGAGLAMMVFMGILLSCQEFFAAHSSWSQVMGIVAMGVGALVGLLQARSAQKKGELHTHAQATKLHHKGAKH